MKKLTKKVFVLGVAVCMLTGLASQEANAQDDEPRMIMSMTEFTVKPGHNTQFTEGIKAWKECYLENEGDWNWNVWSRIQGEGNVYVLTSYMENWAEMDDRSDEAGQECGNLARELINPNVEKATSNMARTIPSVSKAPGATNEVVYVLFFRVKNGNLFRETVREVVSTIRDVEGEPRGYWYSGIGGDVNAPHYFVVTPYENFAAMDVERDGVWTVVENEHGSDKREELQANFRESVDESWSYIYRRVESLSNPGE